MLEFLSGRVARVAAPAAVLGVVAGGAALAVHERGTTVTLLVDGQPRAVDSPADTVQGLLADQHIAVGSRDLVAPDPGSRLHDGEQVVVRFARPFTVTVDGVTRTYWTTALTVDDALSALGIRADGAWLSASRSLPLGRQGLDLAISTPKSVTITADGGTRSVTTTAATVADLLTQQNLRLGAEDRLSAPAATAVTDGLVLTLTRITHRRSSVVGAIPFGTTRQSTSSLPSGQTKVATSGTPGSRTTVYDLLLADGKVAGKSVVSSTVTTAPVDQVVQVGTGRQPAPQPAPQPAAGGGSSGSGGSGGGSSGGGGGSVGGGVDGLNWAALAQCESGGDPRAVNPAGYYGLYQFSLSTLASVGGSGNPIDASPAEQLYRAKLLYKRGGAGQWGCGSRLSD